MTFGSDASGSVSHAVFFPLNKTLFFCLLTGTFGRIFHGVLVDEKDPSKEKQVFVKTVKGMRSSWAFQDNLSKNIHVFGCEREQCGAEGMAIDRNMIRMMDEGLKQMFVF